MALGKSQTLTVTITQANVASMVAIFGLKNRNEELLKYAHPARENYQTIIKSGDDYQIKLTEEATAAAKSGLLVLDVKAWFSDDQTLVKRFNFTNLADNYVAEIEKP